MEVREVKRAKLFGTDGVRGKFPDEIDPLFAYRLGWAVADLCISSGKTQVIIGGDTRASTYPLALAFSSALLSAGISVKFSGITPTPAIAFLVRRQPDSWGTAVSASHNPPEYNGIKVLIDGGYKANEELERQIEDRYYNLYPQLGYKSGAQLVWWIDWEKVYIHYLRELFPMSANLRTKVFLDLAHGAVFHVAPEAFRTLGLEPVLINSEPIPELINVNCGATHPEVILEATSSETGNAIGFSFDGDGDRLIMSINDILLDGDMIMYVIARYMRVKGIDEEEPKIVLTVMSNLGIELALNELGFKVIRVPVGDKFVQDKLRADESVVLGGEQSGHIIIKGFSFTGDGVITALYLTNLINEVGLGEVLNWISQLKLYPQAKANLPLESKEIWENMKHAEELVKLETELGERGRVLVRPSGTEPVLRLMVEAETEELARTYLKKLIDVITELRKRK